MKSYLKRKLTQRQKWIRENYTRQDDQNNTWLEVEHQSFKLELIDDPETRGKEGRKYASWRRDMLAVALDRMIYKYEQL